MYCGNCGSKNKEGSLYCEKCGRDLHKSNVEVPVKRNGNKGLIITVCILGFLLLFVATPVIVWLAWPKDTVEKENKDDDSKKEEIKWDDIKDNSNTKNKTKTKKTKRSTKLDVTEDGEVVIYFFRGEGCSHCAEAEEWFESIEDEYGDKFVVKDYEVWYDEDNAEYMNRIAESRGEDVTGVPYIIIGNKSWNGFAESYKEEMLREIELNIDDVA